MTTEHVNTEEHTVDEDAFEAAFASDRGEESPAPVATEPALEPEVPAEPAPDANPEPDVSPVEPPRLIAGLTEEQLQAALARNASLQGTVDKMAGRLGQLMQQIETLRTAPATPTTAAALDLKLERLSESFPELANLLREDLTAAGAGPAAPVEPVAPTVTGITQEQLDAQLAAVTETTKEAIEVKVLTIMHPDWAKVIRTPQFALWRDTVLPDGEGTKLMEAQDATEISDGLTKYKEWVKATETPTPTPTDPPTPPVPPRANRLANAVLPNGGPAPAPTTELSEEAAFAASFAAEQKRRGM